MFISIIIPVHNRYSLLVRAVKSILQQTHKNFELIIIDDGSDIPVRLVLPSDSRIKYYQNKRNKGVSYSRNIGIKKSSYEWVAFLDSDDEWIKDKLEKQIYFIKNNKEYLISQTEDIWYRNGKFVNPKIKHKKLSGNFFKESLDLCLISPSSVIINKKIFDDIGYFDEKLPACEDYDLWLRVLTKYKVGLLRDRLIIRYAGHDNQLYNKYKAMDRFRIRTLKKILALNISNQKKILVKSKLKEKLSIILSGLKKRKKYLSYIFFYIIYKILVNINI